MSLILRLSVKVVATTSSFMVGLTAASGEIVYLTRGLVDTLSVVVSAPGIISEAFIGAKCIRKLKSRIVGIVFHPYYPTCQLDYCTPYPCKHGET